MSDTPSPTVPDPTGPSETAPHRGRRGWLEWWARPEDRFGVLLTLVIATIVVTSLVDVQQSYVNALMAKATSGAALMTAARASGMGRGGRRVVDAVVAFALLMFGTLAVAEQFTDVTRWAPGPVASPLWLLLVLWVPFIVVRRLASHTVVGVRTVVGTIAVYLQIAVAYAALFQAVNAWSSTPLFGQAQPSSVYTYVSLTTISTLGVGDFVPATDVARIVLASEAIVGQVFLVTVVALVVSRFNDERRRDRSGSIT